MKTEIEGDRPRITKGKSRLGGCRGWKAPGKLRKVSRGGRGRQLRVFLIFLAPSAKPGIKWFSKWNDMF